MQLLAISNLSWSHLPLNLGLSFGFLRRNPSSLFWIYSHERTHGFLKTQRMERDWFGFRHESSNGKERCLFFASYFI